MTTVPASPREEGGDLAGLRVLITGGTRGIGAATVARFLAGGARVVTVARQEAAVPSGVHLVTADLATSAGASIAAEQALEILGGIDVLVKRADLHERFGGALGRAGRGDEAAEAIAFLASSRASYLTGSQIALDGGIHPAV